MDASTAPIQTYIILLDCTRMQIGLIRFVELRFNVFVMGFWIDVLGWIGSLLVIAAYGMLSAGKINPRAGLYQWLNLAGSALLIVNTLYHGAHPSAFVNVVWLGIALYALIKIRLG